MIIYFINQFLYQSAFYLFLYSKLHFIFSMFNNDIFQNYKNYGYNRQLYILSNLIKAIFLFYISLSYSYLYLTNESIQNNNWVEKSYEIKSLVISYVIPDFWSILITSKTMKISTLFHHLCVIIATIFIVVSDLQKIGVHISFMMYGLFSAYTFLVNYFLGARFIYNFSKKSITFTNCTYILSCTLNWNWQLFYLIKNFYLSIDWLVFTTLLYFWISDDIILIKFLKYYNNL